jgi:hypothetical protein
MRATLAGAWAVIALACLTHATPLRAQGAVRAPAPELSAYFDEARARAVQQLIDSAAAAGAPARILTAKAVEGARKGVPAARLTVALRRYAAHLATARSLLGAGAADDVYESAANALLAGVDPGVVRRLRELRPASQLVLPLVVVTDLTLRGVPPDSAGSYVTRLLGADARDPDLMDLQQTVARGIIAGARPAEAASRATEGTLRRLQSAPRPAVAPRVSPPVGPSTGSP